MLVADVVTGTTVKTGHVTQAVGVLQKLMLAVALMSRWDCCHC
jgi:hypothetical protein